MSVGSKFRSLRYPGSHTSGEAIDRGLTYILIAIILGVITEISISVHKKSQGICKPGDEKS